MFWIVYTVIVPINSLWLLHRFCWNLIYTNPKTLTRRINPNFDIYTVINLVAKLITWTVPVVAEICCLTTDFEQEFGMITKHKTFKQNLELKPYAELSALISRKTGSGVERYGCFTAGSSNQACREDFSMSAEFDLELGIVSEPVSLSQFLGRSLKKPSLSL